MRDIDCKASKKGSKSDEFEVTRKASVFEPLKTTVSQQYS